MTTKRSQIPCTRFGEPLEGQTEAPSFPDDRQPFSATDPPSLQRTSYREQHLSGDPGLQFGFATESKGIPVRPSPNRRSNSVTSPRIENSRNSASNLPMTVKDAASFLGVSCQMVYLWVERKQIPHLRVMGRNIRFLRSDLEPFRAQFRQEVANAETA